MAGKKKSSGSKKAKSSSSRKKSSGEGVSMGPVILGATLATLTVGGLIFWMFTGDKEPAVAQAPAVETPAPENPAETDSAQNPAPSAPPANPPASNNPVVSSPAPAIIAPVVSIPFDAKWLSSDTNVAVRIRVKSLLTNPLLKPLLEDPQAAPLHEMLNFLREKKLGDLESVTIGLTATEENLKELENVPSQDPQRADPARGLVLVVRPEQQYVHDVDNAGLLEPDDLSEFFVVDRTLLEKFDFMIRYMRLALHDDHIVMSHAETLRKILAAPAPELSSRFPPVPQNADVVVAFDLSVLDMMQKLAPPGVTPDPEQRQKIDELKAKGVRSLAIAVGLQNGVTISMSFQTTTPAAAVAIREEVQKGLVELKAAIEKGKANLPQEAHKYVDQAAAGFQVVDQGTAVAVNAYFSPELVRVAQNEGPALFGALLASQMGPAEIDPAALGPGLRGPMVMVTDPIQAAAEASGLPGDAKLFAAVGWSGNDALPAAGVQGPRPLRASLALVSGGFGANVVQFRNLTLTSATSLKGTPLKVASGTGSPFVTAQTWRNVQQAMFGAQGMGVLVPVDFSPSPDAASGIAKLEGELELRSASTLVEQDVPAASTGVFQPSAFESLGLRMVAGTGPDAGTIFLFPAAEEVVLLDAQAGVEKLDVPKAAPIGSPPPGSAAPPAVMPSDQGSEDNPNNFAPSEETPPVDDVDGDGMPDEPGRRPPARDPVVTVAVQVAPLAPLQTRPVRSWSPRGLQVNVQQANHITVRVARDLTTSTVAFKFASLNVPAPPVPPATPWIAGKDFEKLPEGFSGVYARALRWDPPQADTRQRRLIMQVDVTGPAAGRIVAVGGDRLEVKGNDGKPISFDGKAPGVLSRPNGYDVILLPQRDPATPLETLRFEVPLQTPDPAMTSLASWSGKFQVKYVKAQEVAIVSNPASYAAKPRVRNEVLDREKVNIKLVQGEGKASIHVPQSARESMVWMELLNRAGDPLPYLTPTLNRSKAADVYEFALGAGTPALSELQLRVIINTQPTMVTIPVEFENIPLPKP